MRKRATAFACVLLPLAEVIALPSPAAAKDAQYHIAIPAGPIASSLAMLSRTTGISIGLPGTLPTFRAPALRGTMSTAQALARLLAGTGWHARRVGATAYRIERDPVPIRPVPPPKPPAPVKLPPAVLPPVVDIVVTGQKRRQNLDDVAISIAVLPFDPHPTGGLVSGSRDLALSVDGLALTNLGSGRNRQFIRGVADSAFNGPSQATVAVQVDEARVTFDAPDPDLRPIDLERIEVLKGPQGALYGSGALGGIYHLVTRKPDLAEVSGSARIIAEAVQHGGAGGGGEAILNLPLKTDELALRGVAYAMDAGGWIDNIGRNRNANRTVTDGGRLALRWQPRTDWTLDLGGILQDTGAKDSQYVTAGDTTERSARIAEPTDNDFKSVAATLRGRVGELNLLATTSYVDHQTAYTLDSSDASPSFGLSGPSRFDSDSKYKIVNHELRLSPANSSRWIAGISYLRAHSRTSGTITSADDSLIVETLDRYATEFAVFGEAIVPLAERVHLTAGARLFRSIAEDAATEQSGGASQRVSKTIVSPSLSLAWTPGAGTTIFLRYARALRPGGLAPVGQSGQGRFDSDDLGTADLGARYASADQRLSASASLFYTDWSHIQSDYLLPNGLISTRNAGRARILGVEASLDWRVTQGLHVAAGGSVISALLVSTENGLKLDDRRLPVVPNMTGRLRVRYDFPLGDWAASLAGQVNYVGSARLTFDEDLDRQMGNYAPVEASVSMTRGHVAIGARIDNALDIKGDSFAFGNQFSIMRSQQYTPLRPRTFSLSLTRSW